MWPRPLRLQRPTPAVMQTATTRPTMTATESSIDDDVGYYSDDDRPEFTSTDSELFGGESDDDDFDGFDS